MESVPPSLQAEAEELQSNNTIPVLPLGHHQYSARMNFGQPWATSFASHGIEGEQINTYDDLFPWSEMESVSSLPEAEAEALQRIRNSLEEVLHDDPAQLHNELMSSGQPSGASIVLDDMVGAFVNLSDEAAVASRDQNERKSDKKAFNITLQQLQQQFGKPIAEAAKELGVSKSTLKRYKDKHGIERWPSHPQNKMVPSLCKANVPETPKDETIILEIHYGDNTWSIFRELCAEFDFTKLEEDLASLIAIQAGSFKVKYWADDNRFLTVRDDDDLKTCINRFKDRFKEAKTTVKIYVIPKSPMKSSSIMEVGCSKRQRVADHCHRACPVELPIQ